MNQPTTLNFTATITFTVQCESMHHAERVSEALRRWSEQEVYRTEPMSRRVEHSAVMFPSGTTPPEPPPSRVNP